MYISSYIFLVVSDTVFEEGQTRIYFLESNGNRGRWNCDGVDSAFIY